MQFLQAEADLRVALCVNNHIRSERMKKDESGAARLDVWSLLKNASTREYDAIAFKFGIVDMRAMLRRLSQINKTGSKKVPCKSAQVYVNDQQRKCSVAVVLSIRLQIEPEHLLFHVDR